MMQALNLGKIDLFFGMKVERALSPVKLKTSVDMEVFILKFTFSG